MRKKTRTKTFKNTPSKKNWGRKVLILTIIVLALLWSWLKLKNPTTFPIRTVKIVDNTNQVDHKLLQETITPFLTKGMLWLNLPQLVSTLEHLPCIESIIVIRKFPATLIIQVNEKKPIAHWNNTQLLDNHGDIFTPNQQENFRNLGQLPCLYGPDNMQDVVWDKYLQASSSLLSFGNGIKSLTMNPQGTCNIYLNNGLHLIINQGNINQRLTQFTAVYPQLHQLQIQNIEFIDLRYNNGFAIHWKNKDNT